MPDSLLANGRFPSISLYQRKRPFLPNLSRFPTTSTSLRRFTSTTFAEQDGRFQPKPPAIPQKLHQPTRATISQTCAKTRSRCCELSLAQRNTSRTEVTQAAPRLAVPKTFASELAFLVQVRLVDPILFSTFKSLTLTLVNLCRSKPLLHKNTGKATRRFPPNFSAIPQNLARLV